MGKTDYKTIILDYLLKHPGKDVKRELLIQKTGISKSRLSEVLHSIQADGYIILSPPRSGTVRLVLTNEQSILTPIKASDVRKWIILFLLSPSEHLTFSDLLSRALALKDQELDSKALFLHSESGRKYYDNTHLIQNLRNNISTYLKASDIHVAEDLISVTALRKDLAELREQKLVTMKRKNHTYYQLSNKAPRILPVSGDLLIKFCEKYADTMSATKDLAPLKSAYSKIQRLMVMDDNFISQRQFGKSNEVDIKTMEAFHSFVSHPYKTNLLKLESSFKGKSFFDEFITGLLFYSVETSCFYALGWNRTKNCIESRRLDRIISITALKEEHSEYGSQKYRKILSEMFSSSYEENVYDVKVLFQDFANIKDRFNDLLAIRESAKISLIENPPDGCIYKYIYEDHLRGLPDFARYLRSFGYSVLALEPPALTDKMLFTYNRILERYGEQDETKYQV